jgi:hypothetical protein
VEQRNWCFLLKLLKYCSTTKPENLTWIKFILNPNILYRCVHANPYYRNVNTIGDSMVLHGHIDINKTTDFNVRYVMFHVHLIFVCDSVTDHYLIFFYDFN